MFPFKSIHRLQYVIYTKPAFKPNKRALESRKRTTFNFKFCHPFSKTETLESFTVLFLPPKLARLFPLKEVKSSPDH